MVTKDGEPWFVAADVCKALGIKNVSQAVLALDGDERGIYNVSTPGGMQTVSVLSETPSGPRRPRLVRKRPPGFYGILKDPPPAPWFSSALHAPFRPHRQRPSTPFLKRS